MQRKHKTYYAQSYYVNFFFIYSLKKCSQDSSPSIWAPGMGPTVNVK